MFSSAENFAGTAAGGGDDQLFMHHHPNVAAETEAHVTSSISPFYHANSLTPFLPSSSSPSCSSDSMSYYYANQNPNYGSLAPTTQNLAPEAFPSNSQQAQHQISSHGFSLTLSSLPTPPPRPLLSFRPVPMGPFTGYSAVLSRSRYLEPARKLLDEVCDVGHKAEPGEDSWGYKEMMFLDADPSLEVSALADRGRICGKDNNDTGLPSSEQQWKKTRLISMLDEVYRRYKQYCQQVQTVITSFESVAGLSSAAPFALMALKAMSKHFRSLKNDIYNQLCQTSNTIGRAGPGGKERSSLGLSNGDGYLQRASAYNSGAFSQPHVWRPQRGLPERAVVVLRAWLFEHFLHPYPTDTDKQILAKQTGLTRNQVSNWFINARVRLWKPMVEEIHSLEMRQKNKDNTPTDQNDCSSDQQSLIAFSSSNPTPFSSRLPHIPARTCQNEYPTPKNDQEELIQMQRRQPMNLSYSNLTNPNHFSIGMGSVVNGGNTGVSLTLGLHQDNGINVSEGLPLTVARRFGLEECSYTMNSFSSQERLFNKDATLGQLFHDFNG